MSDKNADKISGQTADTPPIDPALFERDDVRSVLAALDIRQPGTDQLGGHCAPGRFKIEQSARLR